MSWLVFVSGKKMERSRFKPWKHVNRHFTLTFTKIKNQIMTYLAIISRLQKIQALTCWCSWFTNSETNEMKSLFSYFLPQYQRQTRLSVAKTQCREDQIWYATFRRRWRASSFLDESTKCRSSWTRWKALGTRTPSARSGTSRCKERSTGGPAMIEQTYSVNKVKHVSRKSIYITRL